MSSSSSSSSDQLMKEGAALIYRGASRQAVQRFNKAKAILERDSPDSIELANVYDILAGCYNEQNCRQDALRYYQLSASIRERKAPDALFLADSYYALACLCRPSQQQKTAAADEDNDDEQSQLQHVSYLKKSLAIQEKHHPGTMELANTCHSLGNACTDPNEKISYYKKTLLIYWQKAPYSLDLAHLYNSLGKYSEPRLQLNYYKKALPIFEQQAPDSLDLATTYYGLGRATYEPNEKIHYLQKALSIQERKHPGDLITLANIHHHLGIVYDKCNEPEMARKYHTKARSYHLANEGDYTLEWARSLDQWADDFRDIQNPEEAIQYYSLALEIYMEHAPNDHPNIATVEGKRQVQMHVLRLNKKAKQRNVVLLHRF